MKGLDDGPDGLNDAAFERALAGRKRRPASQQARIDRQYRELRASDPRALTACVHAAEAIGINHVALYKLTDSERTSLLADVEQHLVDMALRGATP